MGDRTVVADVADELARRVASGEYEPGGLMPSVRQVADEFDLNRATAQLILGRLESYGFVDAYRGKGFVIEGTPDLVKAKTREILGIMKPSGGYVASASHDYVLPETPIENVLAMFDTVREYGVYDS